MINGQTASLYDYDNAYYLFFNTSMFEIMSTITEEVIKDQSTDVNGKYGSFQMRFSPTYQEDS